MQSSVVRRFWLQTARRQPLLAASTVFFRRSASTIPSQSVRSGKDDESVHQGMMQRFLEEYASMSSTGSSGEVIVRDNEALLRSMRYVQKQLSEASLCIKDCHECIQDRHDDASNLPEELETANQSLERAVSSLVDWLDEVRSLTTSDQNQLWTPQRAQFVSQVKTLRQQLDELQKRA